MLIPSFMHSPWFNVTDSYTIGSDVVLGSGVSEGVAIIGRYLKALDQAVGTSMDSVASLSKLAAVVQAPDLERQAAAIIPAPILPSRPDVLSRPDARTMPEGAWSAAEPVSRDPRVAARTDYRPISEPSVLARGDESPSPVQLQALQPPPSAAIVPSALSVLPTGPTSPLAAGRPEPDNPVEPGMTRFAAIIGAPNRSIAAQPGFPTIDPNGMQEGARTPTRHSLTIQPSANQGQLPAPPSMTSSVIGTSSSNQTLAQSLLAAPSATAQLAAVPMDPMVSMLAPRVHNTASTGTPAAAHEQQEGVIFLDSSRMGRWIMDHLARQASRAGAGTTGIDPRMGPTYPGAPTGV